MSQLDMLTMQDHVRAERFATKVLAKHFVFSRVMLRSVLAQYVEICPSQLILSKHEYGKPFMEQRPDVHFNMSHTDGNVAIAVCDSCAVGIDIEQVKRTAPELKAIANRFFHPDECAVLDPLMDDAYVDGFYRIWTQKEAFVKGLGRGIAFGLDQFAVELPAIGQPGGVRCFGSDAPGHDWTLVTHQVEEHLVMALAVEAKDMVLQQRQWPESVKGI